MSNVCYADCDLKLDIVKNPDRTFTYSNGCHIRFGEVVQDNGILTEQNLKLNKALDLKDIALDRADKRADKFQNAMFKLEDRITKIDSIQATNKWLYFGLGAAAMFAATYAASQALRH